MMENTFLSVLMFTFIVVRVMPMPATMAWKPQNCKLSPCSWNVYNLRRV